MSNHQLLGSEQGWNPLEERMGRDAGLAAEIQNAEKALTSRIQGLTSIFFWRLAMGDIRPPPSVYRESHS